MSSMNKVFLMGNLTRDPELKYTQGGTAIGKLGLAVNRRYQSRTGEEVEEVCFVDIDVFGKQAESCNNYLRKGAPALIEGRLRLDSWDDRTTGEKRSRLCVVAEHVSFIGPPARSANFAEGQAQGQGQYQGQGQGQGYAQGGQGGQGGAPRPAARPPQPYRPQAGGQGAAPPADQGFNPRPQQQFQAPPPPMPAFDASGLDDGGGLPDGEDIPDQIPF